jgi:hypothetical protein
MNTREIVYIAHGVLDAEMMRAFLESNGIRAFIMQESVGLTYGLTMGPLGECKILVEPQNVATARELIALYEAGEIDQIDFNTDDIDESGFDDAD